MIIKNARIENAKTTTDFRIKDGRIIEMAPTLSAGADQVIDLKGKLVIPPLVDSHVHLDSTLTAG